MAINPSNNTLIRDLIHDNNVYFMKIDSEKEYIKELMAQLEPMLCQCGVCMANHQTATMTTIMEKAGNLCSKVAVCYGNIHDLRKSIRQNLFEIDKIRGAKK